MRRQMIMRRQVMCRRNASSGGIMCLAMCRPKASSASAGMLIPPLRALCKGGYVGYNHPACHFFYQTPSLMATDASVSAVHFGSRPQESQELLRLDT